jgi:hypothetical protein
MFLLAELKMCLPYQVSVKVNMDNDTRCLFLEAFCIYNVLPLGAPSTTEIGALLARGVIVSHQTGLVRTEFRGNWTTHQLELPNWGIPRIQTPAHLRNGASSMPPEKPWLHSCHVARYNLSTE